MTRLLTGVIALVALALATLRLAATSDGLVVEQLNAGSIPITVYRAEGRPAGRLVMIAHGFAGSRPMMQQFAVTLAQNGYLAASFEFSGHGRNRTPLTGDLTRVDGATEVLIEDLSQASAAVREHYSIAEPFALLGHSMASDIVVRYAQRTPDVAATIGVSLFSPDITATSPANLLIINGEFESRLNDSSLAVLEQVAPGAAVVAEHTYGGFSAGTARRLVLADGVEHVGVLFSAESSAAAVAWLGQVFEPSSEVRYRAGRGLWIVALVVAVVALWWALVPLLPVLRRPSSLPCLSGWRLSAVLVLPMLATPLLLRVVPIDFLPVLVGDYLAVHFAVYGLISAALAHWFRREPVESACTVPSIAPVRALVAVICLLALCVPMGAAIHWQISSFVPTPERLQLMLIILVGTLCWFLADEWATRDLARWRFAYLASKLAFLASLGIAVALDFSRLFFLLLIVPIMVPLLLVFGLLSRWSFKVTGLASVAGVVNAIVFAWAIAVTFPLVDD